MKVLIVDDDKTGLRTLAGVIEGIGGIELFLAQNLDEALKVLERELIDVAFIDLQLSPDIRNRDGLKLIQEIRRKHKTAPVVVSGHAQMLEIREAMRHGARDYIFKSEIDEEMIGGILNDQCRRMELEQEVLALRAQALPEPHTMGLIGNSPPMVRLRAMIQKVALSPNADAVLIMGPTGAGKELVARAVHSLGKYPDDPIYSLNCGAIPENLAEAELFGYVKGAFFGAQSNKDGALKTVGRGVLFLDEIADMPPTLQVKFLRVLETRGFRPLGAHNEREECRFEGRIVAATNADLKRRVAEGRFRQDLWHRLNHIILQVPALDERREDIPTLIQYFNKVDGRNIEFSQEAIELLCRRSWPGNVRQLRKVLAPLAIFADGGVVTPDVISRHVREDDEEVWPDEPFGGVSRCFAAGGQGNCAATRAARMILDMPGTNEDGTPINRPQLVEDKLFTEALARTGGHQARAAELLGVHRKVVGRWAEKQRDGGAAGGRCPPLARSNRLES